MKNRDIRWRSDRLGFLYLGSRKETLSSHLPSLLPPAPACIPLLALSTCPILFSFPFCGWRCPYPGTHGPVQPSMAHGSGHQQAGGLWHPWVSMVKKCIDGERLSFGSPPTCWRSSQAPTACMELVTGILLQPEKLIPGGHSSQEEKPCR